MSVTNSETKSDYWKSLPKEAEAILTKLQDEVNTGHVMGSTSTSTYLSSTGNMESVSSVEIRIGDFNWTMTIQQADREPSCAIDATMHSDA